MDSTSLWPPCIITVAQQASEADEKLALNLQMKKQGIFLSRKLF